MIDPREFYDRAWEGLLSVGGTLDDRHYLTNGFELILFPPGTPVDLSRLQALEGPKNLGILRSALDAANFTHIIDADPPSAPYEKGKCPECEGEGEAECNLGHWHECEVCGGAGVFGRWPDAKSGYPWPGFQGPTADLVRLERLLHCLQRPWRFGLLPTESQSAWIFRGQCDGIAVLMIMRDDKKASKAVWLPEEPLRIDDE